MGQYYVAWPPADEEDNKPWQQGGGGMSWVPYEALTARISLAAVVIIAWMTNYPREQEWLRATDLIEVMNQQATADEVRLGLAELVGVGLIARVDGGDIDNPGFRMADADRFAQVPEWIVEATLSPSAFRLYSMMAVKWAHRRTRRCWPSHETMARTCNISLPTTKRAIRELQKAGAIEVTERYYRSGRRATNMYELAGSQRFVNRENVVRNLRREGGGRVELPYREEDPWEADPMFGWRPRPNAV